MMFKEHSLLSQLVANDSQLTTSLHTSHIINQGLAPIAFRLNTTVELQKAALLEQAKHQNRIVKARELCELFTQQKIKFIIFKGFAYNYTLYQQLPLRPASDIDVFIEEKNYKIVEKLLLRHDYKAVISRQGRFISFQNSFYDNNKINTVFDIHWQISNRTEIHPFFQFQTVYNNSITIKASNFSFQTLDSINAFIYACFHFQAHRPEDRKHIWLYDLALMWLLLDKKQQKSCLQQALPCGLYDLVGATLKLLNMTFGKLIVFEPVDDKDFLVKASYLGSRKYKRTDFLQRLKNLNSFKEKAIYLSEYLFQSKCYVQSRYKLQSRRWIYLIYLRMWVEDFLKFIKKP